MVVAVSLPTTLSPGKSILPRIRDTFHLLRTNYPSTSPLPLSSDTTLNQDIGSIVSSVITTVHKLMNCQVCRAEITDLYTDSSTNLTHIYFRQLYKGLPVLNSVAHFLVNHEGEILEQDHSLMTGENLRRDEERESSEWSVHDESIIDITDPQLLDLEKGGAFENERFFNAWNEDSCKKALVGMLHGCNILLHHSDIQQWSVVEETFTHQLDPPRMIKNLPQRSTIPKNYRDLLGPIYQRSRYVVRGLHGLPQNEARVYPIYYQHEGHINPAWQVELLTPAGPLWGEVLTYKYYNYKLVSIANAHEVDSISDKTSYDKGPMQSESDRWWSSQLDAWSWSQEIQCPEGKEPNLTEGNNARVRYLENGEFKVAQCATGVYASEEQPEHQKDRIHSGTAYTTFPRVAWDVYDFVNFLHHWFKALGFTEAMGNFQENHTDEVDGAPGDPVDVIIVEENEWVYPERFTVVSTPDGTRPTLTVLSRSTWSASEEYLYQVNYADIARAYTQAVMFRLVGGPSNERCLTDHHSRGMRKGWGNFIAIVLGLTKEQIHTSNLVINLNSDVYNDLSTDDKYQWYTINAKKNSTNPYFYYRDNLADIARWWTQLLLDTYVEFCKTYGYDGTWKLDSDFSKHSGNVIMLRLWFTALQLLPCQPQASEVRRAIAKADKLLYGGTHTKTIQSILWRQVSNISGGKHRRQLFGIRTFFEKNRYTSALYTTLAHGTNQARREVAHRFWKAMRLLLGSKTIEAITGDPDSLAESPQHIEEKSSMSETEEKEDINELINTILEALEKPDEPEKPLAPPSPSKDEVGWSWNPFHWWTKKPQNAGSS
ncbi:hypothetical protein IWQ62_000590 [Dispira parvispora]|uniref:Extracellular metalloproteinase n=1 Tax=Dispira parvispora TaxID=1520584 RepID=A0A9W8AUD7_9FUNG|nr:hypothetical protein IWQ62_000590 [Dispira parvispora]